MPFRGRLTHPVADMAPVDFVPAESVSPGDFIWRGNGLFEVEAAMPSLDGGQVTLRLVKSIDLLELGVAHYQSYAPREEVLRLSRGAHW